MAPISNALTVTQAARYATDLLQATVSHAPADLLQPKGIVLPLYVLRVAANALHLRLVLAALKTFPE